MVPLLSTATFLTINLFSTTNPCRSTNVGMATSNFLRLHLTPVFLSFIFWIFAERCNLHNFAHYVRHRTVLDYIIVYNMMRWLYWQAHSPSIKFYAHSGALNEFVLLRAINALKRSFSINENTVSSVSKQSIP